MKMSKKDREAVADLKQELLDDQINEEKKKYPKFAAEMEAIDKANGILSEAGIPYVMFAGTSQQEEEDLECGGDGRVYTQFNNMRHIANTQSTDKGREILIHGHWWKVAYSVAMYMSTPNHDGVKKMGAVGGGLESMYKMLSMPFKKWMSLYHNNRKNKPCD